MDIQTFIDNYQETFSGKAELPIAFWYSDTLSGELRKTQGCLFKALSAIRNGEMISMSGESIGCGGGKFYTGFTPMPEHVPNFVSLKERYKQTPEMVLEGIKKIDVQRATKQYIHFARIDRLTSFEDVEGLLFLATPDILSGLVTWAYRQLGIELPHQSEAQMARATRVVSVSEARPGDVLWRYGHVGIAGGYGGTPYVHAPTFGACVRNTDSLSWSNFTNALQF